MKISAKFILFFVILFSVSVYSQFKTTTKKFKPEQVNIEFLGSFAQPLPNLYGEISEFFSLKSYGVKFGFGGQINVKFVTNKKGTLRPYLSLGFTQFQGKNNSVAYIDSNIIINYPLSGNRIYSQGVAGKSSIALRNFHAGLGFEYAFVNKTRWTAYLGVDLDINVLYGTYKQTPTVSAGTPGEISFTIKESTRFGFAFSPGIQFRVNKAFGFVFSPRYRFTNILGKESKSSSQVNKMELLDKSDPGLNSNLNKDRQINYIEFLLGVAFYIGKK